MGSGIGAGILLDGAVYRGASSNTGEIGQLVVDRDHDGRPLKVEQLAAPDAVVADALSSRADSRRLNIDADDSYRSFMRLATAAVQGDMFAERIIRRAANYLADGAVGLKPVRRGLHLAGRTGLHGGWVAVRRRDPGPAGGAVLR